MKRHANKKRECFSTKGTGTTRYSNQKVNMPSLVAQAVKLLPTVQKTRVQSLGREDPLEKEMATHWRIPETEEPGGLPSMGSYRVWHDWSDLAAAANTLAWEIPWMEDRGRLQPMGLQRVGHDWAMSLSLSF